MKTIDKLEFSICSPETEMSKKRQLMNTIKSSCIGSGEKDSLNNL